MRILIAAIAGLGGWWWLRERRDAAMVRAASAMGRRAPAAAAPKAIASGDRAPDDLTRIKGIGPKLASALGEIGIRRFDQIADWSDADVAEIDERLVRFKGRIVREDWIGQAKALVRSAAH